MRFIPFQEVPTLEAELRRLIGQGRRGQQRDALALCLGLHGLRVSEVSLATVKALDLHAGTLTPPVIKRGKSRTVPLDRTVIEALLAWREGSAAPWLLFTGRGKRVFPSHWQRFCETLTREIFGFPYRFHALRHTFAMRLYARTKDLLLVRKMLGHRSITSTLVYADALDDMPRDLLVRLDGASASLEASSCSSSSIEAKSVGSPGVIQRNPAGDSGLRRWYAG